MKKIFTIGLIAYASFKSFAQSPTFEWAKSIGGYYGYASGTSVALDASGNVYTTGYFHGRVDFDASAGIFYLTSAGYGDAFITKTDPTGNFLWAKQLGGASGSEGNSLVTDVFGNIYVAGSFSGTVDFDPGPSTYNLTSAGSTDVFIFKSDASGNFLWTKTFGSYGEDACTSIALDGSGNVYTAGGFMANVDFDPGPGNYYLNVPIGNATNSFISKLNSAGNFVWAKQFEGWGNSVTSMSLDGSGNIYTTGRFTFTNDFDPGIGIFNLTATTGGSDIFISRLNPSGDFNWAKAIEGTSTILVNSIVVDGSGNVYTTGLFNGTTDFDPGAAAFNLTPLSLFDMFISKLDFLGNFVWAKQIGGTSNSESGNAIKVDATGNIYTTGTFSGNTDFDPGPGVYSINSFLFDDIFVLKLNSSGNFVWVKQMGGIDSDYGNAIAIDASGNSYITGMFRGICDFDPDSSLSYNLIALGGNFLFNSKLNSSGNFVWATSAGAGAAVNAKSTAADAAGNVYTTGYFFGIVDFDPGVGTFILSTASTDLKGDIFVIKSDVSGNFIWAKQMGGLAEDYPNSIAVDTSGNVYTTGIFHGTADFDPGTGIYNLTASSTNPDIFVSKLNASGNFVWATKLGNTTWEEAYSITLDASGNIFTAGTNLPGFNAFQIYINKLDVSGNLMWSKSYGGPLSEKANSIAADASGNIYFTGYFSGTTDFDPGIGTFNLTSYVNSYDIFVSKLDASGNFIWAKQMGGKAYDVGNSIALDASGNILTTGIFHDTADFDTGAGVFNLTSAGSYDVFISKLNPSGDFVWAGRIGGTDQENAVSIASDAAGSVYATGNFYGTVDFDPGASTFNLTANGTDVFISKLDDSGNFVWAKRFGGMSPDWGYSIALDGLNNIYTIGTFYETVDFDPDTGTYNLSPIGNPDMFIHKLSQCTSFTASITPSGPTTFCVGNNVLLNANTGTGLTYQWKKNGINISGATSSTYSAYASGNYSVRVVSSICASVSSPVTVSVNTLPLATVTPGGSTAICQGDFAFLNANTGANLAYQWKKNGVIIPGANAASYAANAAGTYNVVVTNTLTGCIKTNHSGTVIIVNPKPQAVITPPGTITFCAGQSALLTANSGTGYTYKWKKNGTYISGATAQTYTVTTAGKYRVEVTNNYGCSKTSSADTVVVPCREGENIFAENNFDVNVFPNPSSDDFTFEIENGNGESVTVEIFDVTGKMIWSETIHNSTFIIQHSSLSPGIYSAVITVGENKKSIRIIKTE
ncbi:MAG: SBBP repeat-containing protein [Bacteroidia bacterium]